jgi:hypothetical protein
MTTPSLAGQPSQAALPAQEEFKDLGFGAEVARGTHRRLLNRNGGFNVVLDGLNPLSSLSLYHWLLTISWPQFLAFIVACYIGVNALFAFAFLLCGPDALQSIVGSFTGPPFYRAFFFSVDSFATIGYGNIIPVGVAANLLVTIEALLNIVGSGPGDSDQNRAGRRIHLAEILRVEPRAKPCGVFPSELDSGSSHRFAESTMGFNAERSS